MFFDECLSIAAGVNNSVSQEVYDKALEEFTKFTLQNDMINQFISTTMESTNNSFQDISLGVIINWCKERHNLIDSENKENIANFAFGSLPNHHRYEEPEFSHACTILQSYIFFYFFEEYGDRIVMFIGEQSGSTKDDFLIALSQIMCNIVIESTQRSYVFNILKNTGFQKSFLEHALQPESQAAPQLARWLDIDILTNPDSINAFLNVMDCDFSKGINIFNSIFDRKIEFELRIQLIETIDIWSKAVEQIPASEFLIKAFSEISKEEICLHYIDFGIELLRSNNITVTTNVCQFLSLIVSKHENCREGIAHNLIEIMMELLKERNVDTDQILERIVLLLGKISRMSSQGFKEMLESIASVSDKFTETDEISVILSAFYAFVRSERDQEVIKFILETFSFLITDPHFDDPLYFTSLSFYSSIFLFAKEKNEEVILQIFEVLAQIPNSEVQIELDSEVSERLTLCIKSLCSYKVVLNIESILDIIRNFVETKNLNLMEASCLVLRNTDDQTRDEIYPQLIDSIEPSDGFDTLFSILELVDTKNCNKTKEYIQTFLQDIAEAVFEEGLPYIPMFVKSSFSLLNESAFSLVERFYDRINDSESLAAIGRGVALFGDSDVLLDKVVAKALEFLLEFVPEEEAADEEIARIEIVNASVEAVLKFDIDDQRIEFLRRALIMPGLSKINFARLSDMFGSIADEDDMEF